MPEKSANVEQNCMKKDSDSRRSFLHASMFGAAAAGLALLRDVKADDPKIEDRGSAIRINKLKAFVVGPKAFVKIETNMNVFGWGEVTGLDPKVACTLAESLFELLNDENPTRVEYLWQKIFRSHRDQRGGPYMVDTLSAIDMALWDITGKLYGVPVYRLLGGPVRDKIRTYPSAKAQKPGTGGPHPWSGDPHDVQQLVKMVEDARKKVGPDGSVMFDCHCAIPPPLLLQFADAIKAYDVLWLEEPAVPGNIETFKRLKAAIKIPIATGERDRTIWGLIPYLQEKCIDIFQPDVGQTGGISQLHKISTLCEVYGVPIAPHNTCSELGVTASFHATLAAAHFLIHECYLDGHIMPPGVAKKNWDVDKDGYASLPQGPGLGVEVDESMFEKVNADPKRKYKWPQPKAPDGSVWDY